MNHLLVVRQAAQDDGYFPRGRSMLRRVHEERMVGLFYGQRALCIGAVMPLNYVGTSEHSYAKLTPFRRLVHTGNAFETIYFGTREEADKVLAYVHKLHEKVKGELPEDAGNTPAGTPYSALDPALMLWTVAVIADSARLFFELFVRRLSEAERDALWTDYMRFAELFGMPLEDAPATWREFRQYWRDQLASDTLFLTGEARYVGYATAFEIPLPRHRQAGKQIHDLIMLGSLPRRVREVYGLSYTPGHAAAYRAAVLMARGARRVTPRFLAKGYNTGSFEMVAKTERRRIEHGEWTPQVTGEGAVPLPRRSFAQPISSTTLPVAPRPSSSSSASAARASG